MNLFISQHIFHQDLEDSIGEAEGHHQVLLVAGGGVESSLPFVTLADPN